jgi:hypothetical protein
MRALFNKALMPLGLIVVASLTLMNFQNCSDVAFSSKADPAANSPLGDGIGIDDDNSSDDDREDDAGLLGGHFDLDTSTEVYELGDGDTNKHVHEYDDKHDTLEADFFNLLDSGFDNIQDTINSGQRFVIIVANAQLSPGAILEINGVETQALAYQMNANNINNVYSIDNGATQLNSLKIRFAEDAILNNQLIPTQTGCVVKNDPGANGEYRNGALILQAIDADNLLIDANLGVALNNDALLWEATIFYHEKGGDCYGE